MRKRKPVSGSIVFTALLVAVVLSGPQMFAAEQTPAVPAPTADGGAVRHLTTETIATYPHDPTAFTQGLLLHGGDLYESTGLHGQSTLRRVDLKTGNIFRRVSLPHQLFGEGLALVDNRLVQLTWQNGIALVYDLFRFERIGQFSYEGEGWGLCHDGQKLIMSDGTPRLTFRNSETFAVIGQVEVHLDGRRQARLNELECVDGMVYANVWSTDRILEIDPNDGRVRAVIDASNLLSSQERRKLDPGAVLNGVAYDETTKTFLLTGKLWPKMFRVRFVE